MKEVKLGPATVTSFRNTTVASAVASRVSASIAAKAPTGALVSWSSAAGPPIGSMIRLPATMTPAAATSGSAGGRWRATIALIAKQTAPPTIASW